MKMRLFIYNSTECAQLRLDWFFKVRKVVIHHANTSCSNHGTSRSAYTWKSSLGISDRLWRNVSHCRHHSFCQEGEFQLRAPAAKDFLTGEKPVLITYKMEDLFRSCIWMSTNKQERSHLSWVYGILSSVSLCWQISYL